MTQKKVRPTIKIKCNVKLGWEFLVEDLDGSPIKHGVYFDTERDCLVAAHEIRHRAENRAWRTI